MSVQSNPRVAVLGCGLMGSAIARALSAAGHEVVVWNRTPDKARALIAPGVHVAASPMAAVESTPLVINTLLDYGTFRAVIEGVELGHTTVVNLSTGSPEQAVEVDTLLTARGATYLDGAILAYPEDIGSPDCLIVYSGPKATFHEWEDTLIALGGAARHVTEEIGGANVIDVGLAGAFFLAAQLAFIESATYARHNGVSGRSLRELTTSVLRSLEEQVNRALEDFDSGAYETDQATIDIYAEASRSWNGAVQASGHRAHLLGAATEVLAAAQRAGLGNLGLPAIAKLLGEPSDSR